MKYIRSFALYVTLATLGLWAAFPVYWMVVSSMKPSRELFRFPPSLISVSFYLDHYKRLLFSTPLAIFFLNSIIVTAGTVLVCVALGSMGAYGLSRTKFKGKEILSGLILLLYMFPPVVMIIPVYVLLSKFQLVDSRAGLILANTTFQLPFSLWLLRAYFDSISSSLDEAALVDGATRWQAFYKIVLPLAKPGITTVAVFSFISSWNEFIYASILINTRSKQTVSVGLYGFTQGEFLHWGELLAAATLVTIPLFLFFLFAQRQLVSGLTAGAVKG